MTSSTHGDMVAQLLGSETATRHLTDPDVTSIGVCFDVVDGQIGAEAQLQFGVRAGAAPVASKPRPTRKDGVGFDTAFLAHDVALPSLAKDSASDGLAVDGSVVVDYTHFSLTMSRSRRFARWVAWNVDGAAMKKLSRSSMKFRLDPRLPADAQIGDELYAGNRLDRGHVARRADLTWGDGDEAQRANSDSFFFTNITPQMDDFNQSRREGVWGRIEDSVYEQVEVQDLRISVFGGPIFHDDDPVYRGVAVPREFWKLVAYVEQDKLKAQAFLLTQNLDHMEILNLDEFRAYQVSVTELGSRTGIDFGDALVAAGGKKNQTIAAPRALETLDDIRW